MKKLIYITLAGVIQVFASCSKTDQPVAGYDANNSDTAGAENVFICGNVSENGKIVSHLWNKRNNLRIGDGICEAIAADENTVAIAITRTDDGVSTYIAVWKNGEISLIRPTDPETSYHVRDIVIGGSGIWLAGTESGTGESRACIWKDGQLQYLSDSMQGSGATSIFIAGEDVYVAGYINTMFSRNKSVAVVWKNGVPQYLSQGQDDARATAVFVSGNDVYVTGYVVDGAQYQSIIWKNGIPRQLNKSDRYSKPLSVYIYGNDVYVCGVETIGDYESAVIWKNASTTVLSDSTEYWEAREIAIVRGSVYVTGLKDDGTRIENYLWIDGKRQLIAKGLDGIAIDMAVR